MSVSWYFETVIDWCRSIRRNFKINPSYSAVKHEFIFPIRLRSVHSNVQSDSTRCTWDRTREEVVPVHHILKQREKKNEPRKHYDRKREPCGKMKTNTRSKHAPCEKPQLRRIENTRHAKKTNHHAQQTCIMRKIIRITKGDRYRRTSSKFPSRYRYNIGTLKKLAVRMSIIPTRIQVNFWSFKNLNMASAALKKSVFCFLCCLCS